MKTSNDYKVLIHKLHEDSMSKILDIERQNEFSWTDGMLRDCFNADYEIYGIIINQKIIAFVIMHFISDEAEILNIAVDKNFRQQGYGRMLLQYILELSKQKNIKKIFLEVRISNIAAIYLYETLGFKKIAVRKNYYAAGKGREDAMIYKLIFN